MVPRVLLLYEHDTAIVAMLVRAGADIDARNDQGDDSPPERRQDVEVSSL